MKKSLIVLGATVLFSSSVYGASLNTYQVTGPVLEVKEDRIVVQKGKEKWEVAKDAATKVTGDPKVGSKVTVEYTMKATAIEVKDAGKTPEKK